jgi:hypothetical protein
MTTGIHEAKERLTKIRVGEVSVVDSPAIEEEFVIIKRLQEDKMDVKEKEIQKKEDQSTEGEIEKVEIEVPDVVGAVMDKVTELIDEVKKTSDDEDDEEKSSKKEKTEGEVEKGSKDGEEAKSDEDDDEDDKENKVKKNDEGKEVDVLEALEGIVQKARRFTPKREEMLKTSINDLQTLLSEISPQEEASAQTEEGVEKKVEKKAEEGKLDKVVKAVGELADMFKEQFGTVNKRIDKIEKRREPSSSIDDDKDTVKSEEKVEKRSLWSGVL